MPDFLPVSLTGWPLLGGAVLLYLLATARSAWRQGEFPQFLRSLAIVAALIVGLLAFAQAWVWVDRHW